MDAVREFLTGSLSAAGAVVEEIEPGLHVLLPAEEAIRLAVPEEVRIATETAPAAGDGLADGRLGSPLLDRLIERCSAASPLTSVALPAELPRPLPDHFPVLLNAVRSGEVVRERHPARYLDLTVRIKRRARRDLERMAECYASLDDEMARAARRARSPDERVRREAKRAGVADDLAARRAQLQERFKTRISAMVIAATVVETDADRFILSVRRRSRGGKIVVTARPGGSGFEGPACAACATVAGKLYLCDERLHVLCTDCGRQGHLDVERCRACKPRSGAAVASTNLLIDDPTSSLRLGA